MRKILLIIFTVASIFFLVPGDNNYDRGFTPSELALKEEGGRTEYVDETDKLTYAIDLHYAAVVRDRDTEGRIIKEQYYGADNKPIVQSGGYYAIKYSYQGKEVLVTYLDERGEPIKITSGYTVVKRILDPKNRPVKELYYDEDMNPV